MAMNPRNRRPSDLARELHLRLGIRSFPVDVYSMAKNLGIQVISEPYDTVDFDGCLIKIPRRPRIIVNSAVRYEKRRTFTVAHEIGHFIIPWHTQGLFECHGADITSPTVRIEAEANEFASELLMPGREIRDLVRHLPPSIEEFEKLAERYGVSFTAAAFKFVQLTTEPCAIVISRDSSLVQFAKSSSFLFTIRATGLKPSMNSIEMVPGSRWFIDSRHDTMVVEESKAFTNLGLVFSLLYLVDPDQRPYDYDEGSRRSSCSKRP